MTELNELKAKYPLAVEALKGTTIQNRTKGDRIDITFVNDELDNVLWIDGVTYGMQTTEDEIGKMLAELLNLIAKP